MEEFISEEMAFIDILPRLPVKSLVRFKSVSKNWAMFLGSSPFVAAHLRLRSTLAQFSVIEIIPVTKTGCGLRFSARGASLLGCDDGEPLLVHQKMLKEMEGRQGHHGFEVVGSCDGLILLFDDSSYVLWNPATRQYRCLPSPPEHSLRSIATMGFGFHPQINDYKLVQVVLLHEHDLLAFNLTAEVLTLGSDSWKQIENEVPPCSHSFQGNDSVSMNGVSYNKVCEDESIGSPEFILSFDFHDEVFRNLGYPPYDRNNMMSDLMVYNELPAVVETDRSSNHIWALKNDGWCKLLTFGPPFPLRVLGNWRNTHFIMMEKTWCQKLYLYDILTQNLKKVPIKGIQVFVGAWNHVESLVWVHAPFFSQ